MGGNVGII